MKAKSILNIFRKVMLSIKFHFTKEREEQAIDMYINKHLTTVEISKYFGCSSSSVERMLKRNNIDTNFYANEAKRKIKQSQFQEICDLYVNYNLTTCEIGEIYNVTDNIIRKILKNNNIQIRQAKRRSVIKNHNYFHKIDTPAKAYFLGWLITDGCIINPNNEKRIGRTDIISLEIHSKDRYILEMFAEQLGANKNIVKDYEKRNHSHIRFASKQMSEDLKQYGLIYKKSHFTYLPKLDDNLMPHLIRGIFDGDGTNYIMKNEQLRFGFYGSKQICVDIQNFLHEKIKTNINTIITRDGCYSVYYGGNKVSKRFYNYIYNNETNQYYLKRKKEKFDKILKVLIC